MLTNPDNDYIRGLDGLRAISVLIVMFSHAGYGWIFPGNLGVTVFFGISGFLITKLIIKEIQAVGKLNLIFFYIRRFFRLFPELFVFIVLCLITSYFIGWKTNYLEFFSAIFYYMNYYNIYGTQYIIGQQFPWEHLWSLAVEEHFYLLFPLLFTFFKYDLRKILYFVIFILIFIPLWRISAWHYLDFNELHLKKATDTRIDSIAWGCLLSLLALFHKNQKRSIFQLNLDKFLNFISKSRTTLLFGIVLILFSLIYRDIDFRLTWRYTVQGIGIFLIIFELVYTNKWSFIVRLLELPFVRYIGNISYGLYIYHWLVFNIVLQFFEKGSYQFVIISFLISFSVAAISYQIIEKRMQVIRKRYTIKKH